MALDEQLHPRSLSARVFISPGERRLRAGWRILLQLALMVVLVVVGAGAESVLSDSAATGSGDKPWLNTLLLVLQLLAMTASVYLARRFLDHRSFRSLGLRIDRYMLLDLLLGIAIAGCLMGLVFVVEVALGWLHFDSFAWEQQPSLVVLGGTLWSFVVFISVGWREELVARGYWLANIADGLNLAWGALLSAVVFALFHFLNPNASFTGFVGIVFGGLFLAYGYVLTRQLWLPIGLHIGWNYFEGPVFGFAVSGTGSGSLIRQTVEGPEIWTGGAFGPEAGLIILPSLLVGIGLIYTYVGLRNRLAQKPLLLSRNQLRSSLESAPED